MSGALESEHFKYAEEPVDENVPSVAEGSEGSQEVAIDGGRDELRDIRQTVDEISVINREIYGVRQSAAERNARLRILRESMGMPVDDSTARSAAAESQEERISHLEKRKTQLVLETQEWIEHNGRENLPSGVVVNTEDGSLEAKGGSFGSGGKEEPEEARKRENPEWRKEWLKRFQAEALRNFELVLREDWATRKAANLDLTIELLKLRAPGIIEKRAADYLTGKADAPSFDDVWIRWRISSPLERFLGRPTQISSVRIVFDSEDEKLLDDPELERGSLRTPRPLDNTS